MTGRFEGKIGIITGAASGLGLGAAERLSAEGAQLVLVDVQKHELERIAKRLSSNNPAIAVTADVSNEEDVARYVAACLDKFGRIDAFFNNAGIEGRQNLTEEFGSDEFHRVLSINLDGVFFGLAAVLKVMREQGEGAVVNTASVGGIRGIGNQSGYAASKHGVVGLTRNSAVEYGQFGIQINAIAPGAIMTAMVENSLRQIGGNNWEEVGEEFVKPNPMRRFGKTEEVSALVAFLLSGEARFINGATIPIDGGQSYKY